MFNRPKKKSNIKELFSSNSPKNEEKTDISSFEPANKKKIKPNSAIHTTTNITNDYKTAVEEITSDLKYKSKPELIGKTSDAAFHYNEIDTDYTQDAKAIALKNIKISHEIKSGKLDKKFYKGINGYAEYNEKSDNSIRSSKFTGSLGPIRAPKHIRVTCRFDYNPSLCKDWHDTGSCVFGDSCIYIHDRGDYKSGWELEKEWEEEQKKKAKNNGHLSDIDTDNEDPSENIVIPEICPICEKTFTHPIITNCEHFFCEKCALNNYSKSSNCFVCKRPTNGTFNDGVKVINKLKEMKINAQKEKNFKKTQKNIDELVHDLDLPEIDENEKKKLLQGIEFDNNDNNTNTIENTKEKANANANEDTNDEHELKNLAGEFKKKRAKQKAQIKYESDWLLE